MLQKFRLMLCKLLALYSYLPYIVLMQGHVNICSSSTETDAKRNRSSSAAWSYAGDV